MPATIKGTLSYRYLPDSTIPVGFEAKFMVYDTGNTVGDDDLVVTMISIDPANATYWSTDPAYATGLYDEASGRYKHHPAHAYDPNGISASWTEQIGDESSSLYYILRGKFDASLGLIQVQANATLISDPTNAADQFAGSVTSISLPIVGIPPVGA